MGLDQPEAHEAPSERARFRDFGREIDGLVHVGRRGREFAFRLFEERHLSKQLSALRGIRVGLETCPGLDKVPLGLGEFIPPPLDRTDFSKQSWDAFRPGVGFRNLDRVTVLLLGRLQVCRGTQRIPEDLRKDARGERIEGRAIDRP
jgi:hypothetical protein